MKTLIEVRLAEALIVADKCLSGHMIGVNCHGPSIPKASLQDYKAAVKEADALLAALEGKQ